MGADRGAQERAGAVLPLEDLPGVGPARRSRLERIGVFDVRDLLTLLPRELERWEAPLPIAEARERAGGTGSGRWTPGRVRLTRLPGRRSLVRATVEDDTGKIDGVFFNQPWMKEQLEGTGEIELEGRVVDAKGPALAAPKVGTASRPLPTPGELSPRYRQAEGISQDFLVRLCRRGRRAPRGGPRRSRSGRPAPASRPANPRTGRPRGPRAAFGVLVRRRAAPGGPRAPVAPAGAHRRPVGPRPRRGRGAGARRRALRRGPHRPVRTVPVRADRGSGADRKPSWRRISRAPRRCAVSFKGTSVPARPRSGSSPPSPWPVAVARSR